MELIPPFRSTKLPDFRHSRESGDDRGESDDQNPRLRQHGALNITEDLPDDVRIVFNLLGIVMKKIHFVTFA